MLDGIGQLVTLAPARQISSPPRCSEKPSFLFELLPGFLRAVAAPGSKDQAADPVVNPGMPGTAGAHSVFGDGFLQIALLLEILALSWMICGEPGATFMSSCELRRLKSETHARQKQNIGSCELALQPGEKGVTSLSRLSSIAHFTPALPTSRLVLVSDIGHAA